MKKILKFSIAAALFMAVLFVNVSINANKEAGDTNLFGFATEANARFECPTGLHNNGVCDDIFGRCHVPVGIEWWGDCDPAIHWGM